MLPWHGVANYLRFYRPDHDAKPRELYGVEIPLHPRKRVLAMICRLSIALPKSAQRRIRVYLRRIANPDRCPRCQSFDTWRWSRGNGTVADIARYFGRQLLTCRGCANLFYVRANNHKPALARAFESIGFEPLPLTRAWRVRPPQEPPAWLDRAAKEARQEPASQGPAPSATNIDAGAGADPDGFVAPTIAETVNNSSQYSASWDRETHAGSNSASRSDVLQTSFVDSAQLSAEVSAGTAIAISGGVSDAEAAGTYVATVKPGASVDALFTFQARQQPENIRQWEDQSWEVCDWEGNVWKTTSAAAAGGSTGALSASAGDVRKAG